MYLTRLHPHLLAAGVLIGLVSAEQHARRGVECYFDTQAASGDTCESLASAWGLSTDDFVKLNPGVICPNLEAGKTYCVVGDSTPDQATSSSIFPKISSTTSTTSAVLTSTVSSTTTKTTPSTSTMPLAASKTTSVTTILPSTTSQTTSITTSKPITSTQSTTMKTSTAAAPSNSPTMPGAASNCNKWYKITSGDACDVVATKNGITVTQLRSWNTQINTSCSNLWADYYVCTGVPGAAPAPPPPTTTTTTAPPAPSNSPALPGAVSNCNKWYKIASGDTCDVLAGKNAITVAQLYRWNTQINSSCNNLLLGYYACVGVPGAAAPMPGIVSNCKRYYQVVSGDSCDSIAQKNGITVANFRRWNTAINTGCTNLWADALVCTSA